MQSFDTKQKFSPWIYRIAHNTFINELKKHARTPLSLFDFDTLIPHLAYDDPATKEREQKEMRLLIDQSLQKLAPKYREIIVLYFLEELNYKEIADILHIPTGTVGIRLTRAKKQLKKYYNVVVLHVVLSVRSPYPHEFVASYRCFSVSLTSFQK